MQLLKALLIAIVVVLAPLPVGGYEAWLPPLVLGLVGVALLIELSRAPSAAGPADGGAWLMFWLAVAGYGIVQSIAIHFTRDVSFYLPDAAGNVHPVLDVGRALGFMLRLVTYGAIAFVVSRLRSREINIVAAGVVLSASFQALYGLINYAGGNELILGIWKHGMHTTSVMGTFYSRNQFAGYLAVALPLGLAWMWRQHHRRDPGTALRGLLLAVLVLYALLLVVALIGSASRLGVTAAVIGVVIWGLLATRRTADHATASTARLFLWMLPVVVLFAVLWFGLDVIAERFLALSVDDARFTIWRIMLDMPPQAWLWGIGPGQFVDVFKLFQDASLTSSYWRALNDPLQFVLEYGIAGTVFTTVVAVWWLRRVWPGRQGNLQAAAIAGVLAMFIHSLGDFDLRVPGTAVLFWTAVGIALRRSR